MVDARFVLVYSTASVSDGMLARGRLEAEGIPVMSGGNAEGPYRMGPVHLYVPADREEEARALLRNEVELAEEEPSARD
jgi:hypothetical protein